MISMGRYSMVIILSVINSLLGGLGVLPSVNIEFSVNWGNLLNDSMNSKESSYLQLIIEHVKIMKQVGML